MVHRIRIREICAVAKGHDEVHSVWSEQFPVLVFSLAEFPSLCIYTHSLNVQLCVSVWFRVYVFRECVRWLTFGWEFYEFTYFDYGHKLGRLAAVLFVSHTHSYLYMTFGKSHAFYGTDDGLVCCVYCPLVAVFVSRIIVVATNPHIAQKQQTSAEHPLRASVYRCLVYVLCEDAP